MTTQQITSETETFDRGDHAHPTPGDHHAITVCANCGGTIHRNGPGHASQFGDWVHGQTNDFPCTDVTFQPRVLAAVRSSQGAA